MPKKFEQNIISERNENILLWNQMHRNEEEVEKIIDSGMLSSHDWLTDTEVSGKIIGPLFKGLDAQKECHIFDGLSEQK